MNSATTSHLLNSLPPRNNNWMTSGRPQRTGCWPCQWDNRLHVRPTGAPILVIWCGHVLPLYLRISSSPSLSLTLAVWVMLRGFVLKGQGGWPSWVSDVKTIIYHMTFFTWAFDVVCVHKHDTLRCVPHVFGSFISTFMYPFRHRQISMFVHMHTQYHSRYKGERREGRGRN